jgi:hypothetical protein
MEHLFLGVADARPHRLVVTAGEYAAVKNAVQSLLRVVAIEDRFDMLAENFDELESEMAALLRRGVVFGRPGWSESVAEIHRVNRRLVNFLSTARLYLDQVAHELSTLYGAESSAVTTFRAACSTEYDGRLGYRAMEALRNYSQHRGTPIHGLTYSSTPTGEGEEWRRLHTLRATIDLPRIAAEGGFKEPVLEELRARGDKAELKPLVREYMTGLGRLHSAVREISHGDEEAWIQALADAHRRFVEHAGTDRSRIVEGLLRGPDGAAIEKTPIFDSFLGRLRELRAKNRGIADLSRQLHSSE